MGDENRRFDAYKSVCGPHICGVESICGTGNIITTKTVSGEKVCGEKICGGSIYGSWEGQTIGNQSLIGDGTLSYGGVPLALGESDPAPAFNLGYTIATAVSTQGLTAQDATIVGTLCATTIDASSAFIKVIDITQYELTGFDVNGDFTISGKLSANGGLSATGGNIYFSDNVGIGTNHPGDKLSIVGAVSASGNYTSCCGTVKAKVICGTTCACAPIGLFSTCVQSDGFICSTSSDVCAPYGTVCGDIGNFSSCLCSQGGLCVTGNTTAKGSISATGGLSAAAVAGTSYFGGNVGIGTNHPTYLLEVAATGDNQDLLRLSHPSKPTDAGFMIGFTNDGSGDNNNATIGVEYGGTDYDVINIQRSTRNVGIGTKRPGEKLTVAGGISASNGLSAAAVAGPSYFGGNVGIGINRPTKALHLGDDCVLALGNDSDLQMLKCNSDGASYLINGGSGNLIIRETDGHIYLQPKTGEAGITLRADSCVQVYYDGSEKLKTQSTGIDVTGTITSDGHDIGGDLSVVGSISASNGLSAAVVTGDSYFGGNVGIGTTSVSAAPSKRLEIAPDTDASAVIGRAHVGYGGISDYAWFGHVDRAAAGWKNFAVMQSSDGNTFINSATNEDILFQANNYTMGQFTGATGNFDISDDNFYVDVANSKVGIGTDAPDTTLHVCATDPRIRVDATANNHPGFEISEAGSRCWLMYNQPDGGSDALTFKNDADRLVIASTGNVGIGDISPDAKLTVVGDISATGGLSAAAVAGTSYFGGNVGIGTNRPTEKLSIATNTDVSAEIGRAHVGYIGHSDYAGFSHIDRNTTTSYALLQQSNGATYLNAANATNIYFRMNNAAMGGFNSSTDFYIDTDTLYVDASEDKVGIGTDAPLEALTVAGNISALGTLSAGVVGAPGSEWSYLGSKVGISNDSNHFLLPSSGDNEAGLHIKSKGDVSLTLEADSDNSGESDNPKICLIQDGSAVQGSIFLAGNASSSYRIPANSMVFGSTNDFPVVIRQNNYAQINIDTSGRVGIGTCNPIEKFTVAGGISGRDSLSASGRSGEQNYFATNVGIGTNWASEALTVAGNISAKDTFKGPQTNYTTITDAAEMAWDACNGHAATVTLGGNRALHNPSNLAQGTYLLKVVQDGTGSRTLSTGYAYHWPGGVAPTLTTGANAVDILTFWSDGTNLFGGVQYNFSLPS